MADEKPIIVVKKKGGHGGHHGGAWKVAYADFVTAMMAFFLVMWLINSADVATKQNIARYFRQPGLFSEGSGSPLMLGESGILDEAFVPQRTRDERDYLGKGENPKAERSENSAEVLRQNQTGEPLSNTELLEGHGGQSSAKSGKSSGPPIIEQGRTSEDRPPTAEQTASFSALAEQIQQELELPGIKEALGDLEVKVEPDGLVIEIMDTEKSSMFAVGSAAITPAAKEAFARVAQLLAPFPNVLDIIGHTDARPYPGASRGYGNWELSADRANAARRLLENAGIPRERVVGVVGRAANDLKNPENPYGVENRRITVKMRFGSERAVPASTVPEALRKFQETPTATPTPPAQNQLLPAATVSPPAQSTPQPKERRTRGKQTVPLPTTPPEENPAPTGDDLVFKERPVLGDREVFLPF